MSRIKVVIVDDYPAVRLALQMALETTDDLEPIASATNGLEAIELCHNLKPDVILMDYQMPQMNGLVATRIIRERWANIQIILLTSAALPEMTASLEQLPHYTLSKFASPEVIMQTIRSSVMSESNRL